jgi:hypothetical protein
MLLALILCVLQGRANVFGAKQGLRAPLREDPSLYDSLLGGENRKQEAEIAQRWAKCVQSLNNHWLLVFGDSNSRELLVALDFIVAEIGYLADSNSTQKGGHWVDTDKVYRKAGEPPFLVSFRFADGVSPIGCALPMLKYFGEAWGKKGNAIDCKAEKCSEEECRQHYIQSGSNAGQLVPDLTAHQFVGYGYGGNDKHDRRAVPGAVLVSKYLNRLQLI